MSILLTIYKDGDTEFRKKSCSFDALMSGKIEDRKDNCENFQKEIIEEIRPWGKFRSFPYKSASHIKIITVNPEGVLSLQYHDYRSEFWIALDKGLEVTVGDKVWQLAENEEVFIPKKTPHRLRYMGEKKARVLEIWIGNSDESDVIRLKDKYGRK